MKRVITSKNPFLLKKNGILLQHRQVIGLLIAKELGEIEDFLIGQADLMWKMVDFQLRD